MDSLFSLLSDVGLILLLILFALVCVFLYRERQEWQCKYEALLREQREREALFLDRVLQASGQKPLTPPVIPQRKDAPAAITEDDWVTFEDRLQERVEVGMLTKEQMAFAISEAREQAKTREDLDLDLWRKPQITGSEFDFE